MKVIKHYLTKNRCYAANNKMIPKGIVVHSTGANNPNLSRYIDDPSLGKVSSEHWNQSKFSVCVHAFIGKKSDGTIAVVQTLPFDIKCWGCGSGSKGSYNNSHIQFEICEGLLSDKKYFNSVYKEAIEFCAYLCGEYGIPVSNITTHCDAYKSGYASNHSDVMHWFPVHGKNMGAFRADVEKMIKANKAESKAFLVKILPKKLVVRSGAAAKYDKVGVVKKGEIYTIVKEKNGYGMLKSGVGWIKLLAANVKRL